MSASKTTRWVKPKTRAEYYEQVRKHPVKSTDYYRDLEGGEVHRTNDIDKYNAFQAALTSLPLSQVPTVGLRAVPNRSGPIRLKDSAPGGPPLTPTTRARASASGPAPASSPQAPIPAKTPVARASASQVADNESEIFGSYTSLESRLSRGVLVDSPSSSTMASGSGAQKPSTPQPGGGVRGGAGRPAVSTSANPAVSSAAPTGRQQQPQPQPKPHKQGGAVRHSQVAPAPAPAPVSPATPVPVSSASAGAAVFTPVVDPSYADFLKKLTDAINAINSRSSQNPPWLPTKDSNGTEIANSWTNNTYHIKVSAIQDSTSGQASLVVEPTDAKALNTSDRFGFENYFKNMFDVMAHTGNKYSLVSPGVDNLLQGLANDSGADISLVREGLKVAIDDFKKEFNDCLHDSTKKAFEAQATLAPSAAASGPHGPGTGTTASASASGAGAATLGSAPSASVSGAASHAHSMGSFPPKTPGDASGNRLGQDSTGRSADSADIL